MPTLPTGTSPVINHGLLPLRRPRRLLGTSKEKELVSEYLSRELGVPVDRLCPLLKVSLASCTSPGFPFTSYFLFQSPRVRQLLIGKQVTTTYDPHSEPFTIGDVTVSDVETMPAYGWGGPSVRSHFVPPRGLS